MIRVLFLCTGNSCRSQMAEGFARALKSDTVQAASAGIEKHGLNPHAAAVMAEVGVDISDQISQTVDELDSREFDYVITLCGHAHETCPMALVSGKKIHKGFDDPPRMVTENACPQDPLDCYRTVRDRIREFVADLPDSLPG
jgi:arsenate reductase